MDALGDVLELIGCLVLLLLSWLAGRFSWLGRLLRASGWRNLPESVEESDDLKDVIFPELPDTVEPKESDK